LSNRKSDYYNEKFFDKLYYVNQNEYESISEFMKILKNYTVHNDKIAVIAIDDVTADLLDKNSKGVVN
jgi:endonuclease III-like uncharacterized protein